VAPHRGDIVIDGKDRVGFVFNFVDKLRRIAPEGKKS